MRMNSRDCGAFVLLVDSSFAEMTREASLQAIRSLRTSQIPSIMTPSDAATNLLQYAQWMDQPFAWSSSPPNIALTGTSMFSQATLLEHFERQKLFASLATASSMTGATSIIPPHVLMSLLQHQQPTEAPVTALSPHVHQYLLQHTLNRLQQQQHAPHYHPSLTMPPTTTGWDQQGNALVTPGPVNVARGPSSMTAGSLHHHPTARLAPPSTRLALPSTTTESLSFTTNAACAAVATDTTTPLCLPMLLYRPSDATKLSSLQCWLRQQVQVFSATSEDISTHVRGRNKSVKLGQVGIRCVHCAKLPIVSRFKGSTYFPTSVWGVYQASQNMLSLHLTPGACPVVPINISAHYVQLAQGKNAVPTSGAGRPYWAETAQELGLVDTMDGIYFVHSLPPNARFPEETKDGCPGVYRKNTKAAPKLKSV
jgi:hypothetical protein